MPACSALFKLTALTTLDASDCGVRTVLGIRGLVALTSLDLDNCRVREVDDEISGKLAPAPRAASGTTPWRGDARVGLQRVAVRCVLAICRSTQGHGDSVYPSMFRAV